MFLILKIYENINLSNYSYKITFFARTNWILNLVYFRQTRLTICSVLGCNLWTCIDNVNMITIENMGSWLFWWAVSALKHEEYIHQASSNQKKDWNSLGAAASFYFFLFIQLLSLILFLLHHLQSGSPFFTVTITKSPLIKKSVQLLFIK